ncbi:hypothetical protein E2562_020369 [Oryza meyeriana var. granulata]|uniref:Uncharacterized protein n=1 Tax=Oryza meyeriana var. granulata TaxID=110450 RepID=A0A6G1DL95_9ORYZ|nr:hypothetical protein E2562_020369 [Oryza meyeriana var. granulata]
MKRLRFPFLRGSGGGAWRAGGYRLERPEPPRPRCSDRRRPPRPAAAEAATLFSQTPPPRQQRTEIGITSQSFKAVLAAAPWRKEGSGSALERVEAAWHRGRCSRGPERELVVHRS